MHTITGDYQEDEAFYTVISSPPNFVKFCEDYTPQYYEDMYDTKSGIRDVSRRHDAMARRKYVKPFKWFKFNRTRKATAK